MANDLKQKIDEKIRRLEKLREIADDPESLEMLKSLLNGNGAPPPPLGAPKTVKPMQLWGGMQLDPPPSGKGSQLATVTSILFEAKEPVTTDWIYKTMVAQ